MHSLAAWCHLSPLPGVRGNPVLGMWRNYRALKLSLLLRCSSWPNFVLHTSDAACGAALGAIYTSAAS
jgi:hypothetical protein